MNTLRIGIIGCGGICAQRHVPGLRRIEGVELVTVCNRSSASSAKAAKTFGIPETDESPEALIARDDLDAVVIGTWPYRHKDLSIAALTTGKHVFCQARMAMDLAEAEAMYAAARASGRVAMLCPVPIGLKYDATVSGLLREDALGEVRLVCVTSLSDAFLDADAPMNWRKDHRLSGLNMHTFGMYAEVMHRWFGPSKTVTALSRIFTPERVTPEGEKVTVVIPDQYLLATETLSGVPVQYTFSTAITHPGDQVMVYGSEGALRYDVSRDVLHLARRGADFEEVPVRPEDAYDVEHWRVEQDFVAAIREGTEYHPDFKDGLHYMQVVQAAHDSAKTGQRVAIA